MMNFGLALLTALVTHLVLLSIIILLRVLKLKATFKDFLSINSIVGLTSSIGLMFILSLCIFVRFSDVPFLSILMLSASTSLITIFIPYESLINKIKNKEFKKISITKTIGFSLSLVFVLLEVVLYSNLGNNKNDNYLDLLIDHYNIAETTGKYVDEHIEFDYEEYIVVEQKSLLIENIYFDISYPNEYTVWVNVEASNDMVEYVPIANNDLSPNYDTFKYISTHESNNYKYFKFTFIPSKANVYSQSELPPVVVNKIIANKAFPFIYNTFRVALCISLVASILLIAKRAKNLRFREISILKSVQKTILIATGIALVIVLINASICTYNHYVEVASISGNSPNIYYQLFDAFRKGQLHLDVAPSAELLALENPYDPSARSGVYYLWDHAFYNGKYFCYYGSTPVLLVMFPIYFLTGGKYTASLLLMEEIGTVLSISAFSLGVTELAKLLFKKINLPAFVCTLIAGIFTSLLLSNCIYKIANCVEGIYRLPYAYGLLFMFSMFFFFIRAFHMQKRRISYLALGGLAVVLMVASRPTLIVSFILIIPLLIKVILEKYDLKKKIIDLIPMVVVVTIGAVILMIYNYKRFDSILEFGQSYQLTVTDNTKLAYSVEGILPTLFNFYLILPYVNIAKFPHIQYAFLEYLPRYHVYNAGGIGLLSFPLFYSMLAMPFIFKKEDNLYLRIMLYMSPFIIFLIAFTTYCYAGYCPRYVVELTALSAFIGIITTYKLFEKIAHYNGLAALIPLSLVLFTSASLGFNLLFESFDGWIAGDVHGLLEIVRSIFNNYNI